MCGCLLIPGPFWGSKDLAVFHSRPQSAEYRVSSSSGDKKKSTRILDNCTLAAPENHRWNCQNQCPYQNSSLHPEHNRDPILRDPWWLEVSDGKPAGSPPPIDDCRYECGLLGVFLQGIRGDSPSLRISVIRSIAHLGSRKLTPCWRSSQPQQVTSRRPARSNAYGSAASVRK